MKKDIHIFFVLLATLFFVSCQNNDAVFLKELKQQNAFLEEQLSLSKTILWAKASGNQSALPYCELFMKQDSITRLFFKTLNTINKNNVDAEYASFKNKSDNYFKESQLSNTTKILLDDQPLLYFKNDTIQNHLIVNDSLKRQLIKQQILQHYLVISQLFYSASSVCGIRFDNPNHFGFRLTIEKNSNHFLLNLKCFDPSRFPHFEKLEFISLSKNNKGDYYYEDVLADIKQKTIELKQEKDAIILKTKTLENGFYRIYCNKLSISDNGRLVKQKAEFDFEITDNQ